MVFFLKNILIPNVAEKNILILVEEKKNLIQRVFVIYPNVEFWRKKIGALRDKKNKYSTSRVVRKIFSERNKKP